MTRNLTNCLPLYLVMKAFFSWRTAQRLADIRKGSRRRTVQYAVLGFSSLAASGCTLLATADSHESTSQLPINKLACHRAVAAPHRPAVLVSCGSFNPPTMMHLRMFDLATAALAERGWDVWGCYMSPVADDYGKQGLVPVVDRVAMCQLAAAETAQVMVDDWEARQPGYTRTLQVLQHVQQELTAWLRPQQHQQSQMTVKLQAENKHTAPALLSSAAAPPPPPPSRHGAPNFDSTSKLAAANDNSSTLQNRQLSGPFGSRSSNIKDYGKQAADPVAAGPSAPGAAPEPGAAAAAVASTRETEALSVPRVMLLCGADLLATIAQPGVWKDPDIILREYGIVCISRAGTDVARLLDEPGSLLHQYKDTIIVVDEPVGNGVSSTKARQLLASGQPVRYLVPDPVIRYIKGHGLYCDGGAGTATAAAL